MSSTLTTSTPTSTDTAASTSAPARRRSTVRSLWAATAVSGVVAAAATTLIAVVARAGNVALDVDGEKIPLLGFAQMTLIGAVIGGVLATAFAKWARSPRRTYLVTTGVLTALSLVPDVLIDASTAGKLVLGLTHLVAAAVVVPAQAAGIARTR